MRTMKKTDALNSFLSLSVSGSLNENNTDASNSKQLLSRNVWNSSANNKKLKSTTLLSNNLTATVPVSTNEEISVNKERDFMSNAILALNKE